MTWHVSQLLQSPQFMQVGAIHGPPLLLLLCAEELDIALLLATDDDEAAVLEEATVADDDALEDDELACAMPPAPLPCCDDDACELPLAPPEPPLTASIPPTPSEQAPPAHITAVTSQNVKKPRCIPPLLRRSAALSSIFSRLRR